MTKENFIQNINSRTEFNTSFFKKVYGYSVCDSIFLTEVAKKLVCIERKDVIDSYNEWYREYKIIDDNLMQEVSKWYQIECDKRYQKLLNS